MGGGHVRATVALLKFTKEVAVMRMTKIAFNVLVVSKVSYLQPVVFIL